MQPSVPLALLSLVAMAIVVASAWCWLLVIARAVLSFQCLPAVCATSLADALRSIGVRTSLPLVAWSPRRPVPWAFFDLVAFIALWLVASLAISIVLKKMGTLPDLGTPIEDLTLAQREIQTIASITIALIIAGVGLPLTAWRTGATARDFGWSPRDLLSDLRLGLIGFVMLAPPTYALQAVLQQVWKESHHPIMEMFRGTPDRMLFVILFVAAALVAPVFEELMFRVLLQGFLEKAFRFRGEVHELFFGSLPASCASSGHEQTAEINPIDSLNTQTAASDFSKPGLSNTVSPALGDDLLNPYLTPGVASAPAEPVTSKSDPAELRGLAAWLPIAVSSLIFALMHWDHGPDWVPLTFLAAGMGYLYQRTHRLVPSLVVHMCLNGLSMWGLWVYVQSK